MAGGTPKSEDELARTATAVSAAGMSLKSPIGDSLGKFRLERELGAGGMGVVHAAFDPDLERRVALKVLRTIDGGAEARERLLREAKAMARLHHPNVIVVHEVGSAGGRDYVAMELIDGETLGDWLKSEARTPQDIIDAFVAAGRGLAHAHAAGLVHRDFKPNNVLRQRDGRIVVTDFGLARGVETAQSLSLETTLPLSAAGSITPSSASVLSGLTRTGSVLGTPAYMAPEQWNGGVVGPAADQFAFCVALWEALTGERPFRGDTIDALKAQVGRGPETLDASKLPRRLRRVIRRGLDPDPRYRWPSMNALLTAILRAERRPVAALVIIGGALVAMGVVIALVKAPAGASCARPLLDPARVWSASQAAAFRSMHQAPAAEAISSNMQRWTAAYERTCHAEPATREPHLACLSAVLARTDVIVRSVAALTDAPRVDAGSLLIDPELCDAPHLPRLVASATPELRDAFEAWLRADVSNVPINAKDADALIARTANDPCASALALAHAGSASRPSVDRRRLFADAENAARRCGDDRIIAETALVGARFALEGSFLGEDISGKVKLSETTAEQVAQPDVTADIDLLRAEVAARADHLDEAIARTQAAVTGYAKRGRVRSEIAAGLGLLRLLQQRSHPDDLATIPSRIAQWRATAAGRLSPDDEIVRRLDLAAASWQWASGDVAGAHAKFEALRRQLPIEKAVHVKGRVVDTHGAPAAGVLVVGGNVSGDSAAVYFGDLSHIRTTTTAADGTFEFPEVAADGVLVAQRATERTNAVSVADGVTLELAPTSRIEGKVDLRGEQSMNVVVTAERGAQGARVPYEIVAPVKGDGSYSIEGVPRGKVLVHTGLLRSTTRQISGQNVVVDGPVAHADLSVAASRRTLHVIVRSSVGMALQNAQVIVMPGVVVSTNALALNQKIQAANIGLARQVEGEHAPQAVVEKAKSGDLYATVTGVPDGVVSACAVGLPSELSDPDLNAKVVAHLDKIEVRCTTVQPVDAVVTVVVPPWPRFD